MAKAYDAFISYSHAADARLATALELGLERLARPWNRLRAMAVFRDENDLTLNPDLWGMISGRLDRASFLVLLMCPESAGSPWVNKEVAHWCDTNGVDRVLMVWTAGDLEWDDTAGDFTSGSSAVADAMRGRFAHEPLYLDLRWARDEPELTLNSPRFRTAVAHVAAPIRGMAPGDLEGEDVRLRRRAKRLARAAVTAVVLLAIVASIAGVLAVRNARAADARAREAVARQVGLAALDLPASEIDRALLMSLVSADLADHDDGTRFQPAQVLIGRYSRLESLLHLGDSEDLLNVRDLAFAADGSVVAIAGRFDGSNALATWRPGASTADVEVLPAGAAADAEPGLASLPGSLIAVDPSGQLAWIRSAGELMLVRVHDGAELVRAPATGTPLVDARAGGAVAMADTELVLYDADGRVLASAADVTPAVAAGVAPAGDAVVTAAGAGSLQRGPVERAQLVASPLAVADPGGVPPRVVIARDGGRVLIVGSTGTEIVDLGSSAAVASPGGGTTVIATDPSGRYVAVGGSRLSVWDLDRGQRIIAVPQVAAALDWSAACDQEPACKLVAGGVAIDVFDPVAETQLRLVDEIGAQAVAISPDGGTVVSGGWGENLAVWSVGPSVDDSARHTIDDAVLRATPSIAVRESLTNADCQDADAVSPSGEYTVAVGDDAVTRVCATAEGGTRIAVARLNPDAGDVTVAAVDDDGNVALGRSSGIVEVYPVSDGVFGRGRAIDVRVGGEQVRIQALAYRGGVVAAGLAFADAGQTPARVVVWSLARMEPTSFPIDQHAVAGIALLDDVASVIVVAGRDEATDPITVQLWDAATRRRVGRALTGLTGDMTAFVGGDDAVLGADSAGHRYRWDIDRDPTRDVCAMSGRAITPAEWDSFADGALTRYRFDDPCD